MSIVDHTLSATVPYSPENTYAALKKALGKIPDYKIDRFDDVMKTAYLKAGVSLRSWGENITVTIENDPSGGSLVKVLSTPKTGIMFGGLFDLGKNRQNIDKIMKALSETLTEYPKIEAKSDATSNADFDYDALTKLKKLLDDGVITQEEYDAKKKQILGL